MKKPKELWLLGHEHIQNSCIAYFKKPEKDMLDYHMHVIEYSAYAKVCEERDELKAELEHCGKSYQEVGALWSKAADEADALRAENERMKAKLLYIEEGATLDDFYKLEEHCASIQAKLEIAREALESMARRPEGSMMDGWFIDEARQALEKLK